MVSLYAPNGRTVGSPFYEAKLAWYDRLAALGRAGRRSRRAAGPGRRLQSSRPTDRTSGTRRRCHGGTHVSPPEREAFVRLCRWGLIDAYRLHHPEPERYSWWDYRAGDFHKNFGMRIDHLLVTRPVAERTVWAEIDREARKGKPMPSDHAPVVIDLDRPGRAFDAGWGRIDRKALDGGGSGPQVGGAG